MKPLIAALLLLTGPVWAFDVPSGQPIELQEVLIDDLGGEIWLRFRFVAPQISRDGPGMDADAVFDDMLYLCKGLAIPYIAQYDLKGDVIVISLADQATEFGAADPDTTQLFEAYRPKGDTCIWEAL